MHSILLVCMYSTYRRKSIGGNRSSSFHWAKIDLHRNTSESTISACIKPMSTSTKAGMLYRISVTDSWQILHLFSSYASTVDELKKKRRFSWRRLGNMEASRIWFIIRGTYDLPPSKPQTTVTMGKTQSLSLFRNILSSCKVTLAWWGHTQRYTQMLRSLKQQSRLGGQRLIFNC